MHACMHAPRSPGQGSVFSSFRCFTGENWQRIMLSSVGADCDDSVVNKTTCGSDFSYVFFPVFFFISSILVSLCLSPKAYCRGKPLSNLINVALPFLFFQILNLFVAIIIDNFDYYVRDMSILGSHHLRIFPKLWSKFETTKT